MVFVERIWLTLLTISIGLIIYQGYFFVQRRTKSRAKTPSWVVLNIDKKIRFIPGWFLIYTIPYYMQMLLPIWIIENIREYIIQTSGALILSICQFFCFFAYPIRVESAYREMALTQRSSSILYIIQRLVLRFDDTNNCMPSMHSSISMYCALCTWNIDSDFWYILFLPILIGISCLYTKQHYVLDVLAGYILGAGVYSLLRISF